MSYTQILILIISSFAFCYLIYSATERVSAQGIEGYACCEKTNGGNFCQYVPEEQCDSGFKTALTQCDKTSFCKSGCCYSSSTGWCNENTPQTICQGQWFDDNSCNIKECERGCCVLGKNALWTTQRNCQAESLFLGLEQDFRPEINSELECIFLAERDDEGACVVESGLETTCVFITRGECVSKTGSENNFYKNTFCSGLVESCSAQENTGCIDGDDSVYWFDSCGNREDVAEECSIFTGTICGQYRPGIDEKPDAGDYVCRSLDCKTKNGVKKNGESWCEYDGTIGDGKDVVGSRHIKHICYMGEERIEPCSDYRNQICVGTETDLGNTEKFLEAACRINNWRMCLDYNNYDKERATEKCNENPDCMIKNINIDKNFKFDFCVPKYPAGFNLKTEASGRNAEMVCSMGSQKCTVVYVKRISGWKCEYNCDCEEAGFAEKMNELCTSLGDCGAYVNYAKDVSDEGYSVLRSPSLSAVYLNKLKSYARDKSGQIAEPGDLSFLGEFAPEEMDEDYAESLIYGKALGVYGVGFMLQVASWYAAGAGYLGLPEATALAISKGGIPITTLGSFGNILASAAAALTIAHLLNVAFGVDYGVALTIAGVSVAVAYAIKGWTFVLKWFGIPALIFMIVFMVIGIGKSKKRIVTFNCMPWQPPTGGDNCNKCNSNDPLGVPCSDYRCNSLGQTCELINKGTGQELCIDNSPTDISSPRISPLYGEITQGYEYYNIQNNGFEIVDNNKNCIPEFTEVLFGIETDKPAQCKIGNSPLQIYEQMGQYFGGSNLYLVNHTMILNMPSPEAFKNQYNLTDEQIADLGEINYYIKCKSVNGVVNSASYTVRSCVEPGPDLTAPRIVKTEPLNNAYVKYDAIEQALQVYINEPSNCKYSSEEKAYELMENSMSCEQDLEDYSLWGWPCNTKLSLGGDNKFYIRCQDIAENKNTMTQSYVYELQKSNSELVIEDLRPVDDDEILSGVEPVTLELQVKTSGGAESGKAICYYDFGTGEISFFDTNSNYHKQLFNSLTRGRYNIGLRCEDIAGNTAEASTSFKIRIDNIGPRITRLYYESGLKIWTNEEAECRYAFTKRFDWENAAVMSGWELEHTADWQLKTYYLQCKDVYGNLGGKMAVKAYSLVS